MAAIILPRIDPDDRERWRLAEGDPGPRSLPKMRLAKRQPPSRDALGGSSSSACPIIPDGGPGRARLDAIVREARQVGRVHDPKIGLEGIAAGAILARNSKTNGPWDIKHLRDDRGRKLYPNGRDFGNFLYGATSTGMGFDPLISDLGADAYSLLEHGTLEDQDVAIRSGQQYARRKCDQR